MVCDRIQLTDRTVMDLQDHVAFEVWVTTQTRSLKGNPPMFKMLRLMQLGAPLKNECFESQRSNLTTTWCMCIEQKYFFMNA